MERLPAAGAERYASNAKLSKLVASNLDAFKKIDTIDHSRLAAEEGVTMPPSVLTIYSDPAVNTALMKLKPRVGLDLPCKVLVYEESGKQAVAFPAAEFLAKRHSITESAALSQYSKALEAGLSGVEAQAQLPVGADKVTLNYGIGEIVSDFPLKESIARLKKVVMSQGDTVWLGDIDFQSEAAEKGEKLSGATLLLFGGPKPGGVAMAKFPKLGLDAFCQKLLVYEDEEGAVKVIFNDIVAMAELHYGTSADPHKMINGRLMKTFESAVKESAE